LAFCNSKLIQRQVAGAVNDFVQPPEKQHLEDGKLTKTPDWSLNLPPHFESTANESHQGY
jgi:hypothetical protein